MRYTCLVGELSKCRLRKRASYNFPNISDLDLVTLQQIISSLITIERLRIRILEIKRAELPSWGILFLFIIIFNVTSDVEIFILFYNQSINKTITHAITN